MFGYIRAYKPNLTFAQYDVYKGVYCSLCKEIGKRYGLLARMTLSYDLSFFAMMRMSMTDECVKFQKSACSFNPLKKCLKCPLDNKDLEYSADVLMLMVYYKYLDNLDDCRAVKRFFLKCVCFYFKKLRKKARLRCPDADKILETMHSEQALTESGGPAGIDEACHPSAKALGELLVLNKECESSDLFRRFGYAVGRWVYLIDAADDYPDDKKTGSFNPFLSYSENEYRKAAESSLNLTAGEAVKCFNELKIHRFRPILSNILYDGMFSSMKSVLREE